MPKGETRKQEWIEIIKSQFQRDVRFPKFSFVCSLHFEKKYFNFGLMGKRLRLTKAACPTIFNDRFSISPNLNNTCDQLPSEENLCDDVLNNICMDKVDEQRYN